MESQYLSSVLESLLFVSGRPLKAKDLAKILEVDEPAVQAALKIMVDNKKTRGVVLLENKGEYQLATNSENSSYVKNFLNAELREKLTDATVEVMAIIAYRQPISKAEIEAIRGVNSQYSIRNLLMRGLIEKVSNPGDARSVLYQTTTESLMHLGITSIKDLPEFEKLVEKIKLPDTPGLSVRQPEVKSETVEAVPATTSATEESVESALETAEPTPQEEAAPQVIGESVEVLDVVDESAPEAVTLEQEQEKTSPTEPAEEAEDDLEDDEEDEEDDEE